MVAFLIICCFLYILLVIADYLIARSGVRAKAVRIHNERIHKVDFPQRKVAISEGFVPIFYPTMLDEPNSYWASLAEKYSVAPLAAQPNTAVYFCNEGYGLKKYHTDKFGFRNKQSVWDSIAEIVLIGDSFTHGACLENDQTIAGNLEDQFNVINIGTSGNHPIIYAALAKNFLSKIKPKYAVMIFYANDNQFFKDIEDSYHYKYFFIQNRSYFSNTNELLLNPNLEEFYKEATASMLQTVNKQVIDKSEGVIPSFIERGSLFLRASKYLSLPTIRILVRGVWSSIISNKNILDSASKLAIYTLASECQRPCEPLIVYIPNSDFWDPDSRAKSYENLLAKQAEDLNISFWSASKELSKIPNNEAYAIEGSHLSPLGYSIVAKGIKQLVNAN